MNSGATAFRLVLLLCAFGAILSLHHSVAFSALQDTGRTAQFATANVRSFGARGDGVTDDTQAFLAAVAATRNGGAIYVPAGTYRITRDILYADAPLNWVGDGYASVLDFKGAGLIIGGGPSLSPFTIEKMRIQRSGSPGAALALDGSPSGGVERWALRDLFISSAGGTGLYIEGSWIGTMDNIIVQKSRVGVDLNMRSEDNKTSMNALTVTGGEVQSCTDGWLIKAASGVAMFGHVVEGNTRGITTSNTARGITIHAGYFEANREYDISVGHGSGGAGYGIAIRDSTFWAPGGKPTPHAIHLLSGGNIIVEGNSFIGYTRSGVRAPNPRWTPANSIRRNYLSSTPLEVSSD